MENQIREKGTKVSAEKSRLRALKAYYDNPNYCANCGKIIEIGEYERVFLARRRKFCSRSCSASFNNANRYFDPSIDKRTKDSTCVICGNDITVNIRSDLNKCTCNICKKKRRNDYASKLSYELECVICGDIFNGAKRVKTCSIECKNMLLSIKRSKQLLEHGSNNFSTNQGIFSYKNVEDISCESILERSAVVYLVDCFNADFIERFKSILNFYEGDFRRTFNPDFFVVRDDTVFIVEVKMKQSKKSSHKYNRTIPLKRTALQKFCDSHGYVMIWLDFDFDPRFKKIYDKMKNIA